MINNDTTSVLAVYEGGLLRPAHPLPFGEGESVEVTVVASKKAASLSTEDEVTNRLKAAKTLDEWIAATKLLPPDDGGYDFGKALLENRIWSGEPPARPFTEGSP